jgi:hypothetical protein
MIRTLVAIPYELVRLPFALVDNRLSDRLSETSTPRVTLDRALGSADKLAGSLLGNRYIARRGADRLERSEKLLTVNRLEEEAATRREEARETLATGRREAVQKRKAAQNRAASGLDEAAAAEARGKQQARATARKTAATKKAAADKRAASRTATIEQRRARVDSAAEAKKRTAQRQAKDELSEARKSKQSAAESRADAARLRDLAEAKKQARKQD